MSDYQPFRAGDRVVFTHDKFRGVNHDLTEGQRGRVIRALNTDQPRVQVEWDRPELNRQFPMTQWPSKWFDFVHNAFFVYDELRKTDP